MGITRSSLPKRRLTGGKKPQYHKKRKYDMGRQMAMTKIGAKRIHSVRVRGGNQKFRAMRLDTGNFSWGSEVCTRKTRILDVVYNASNNELVRTKTLVKNAIVQIDATCAASHHPLASRRPSALSTHPRAPWHSCARSHRTARGAVLGAGHRCAPLPLSPAPVPEYSRRRPTHTPPLLPLLPPPYTGRSGSGTRRTMA